MIRSLLLPLVAALGTCTGTAPDPEVQPQQAGPALVVLITVDQLHRDYLRRFRSQFTGGLARLLNGGAVFTNAFHEHAISETAPGHASLLSGRFPRSTGITRNLLGVQDRDSPMLGSDDPGASPHRFRGTGLYDWMVAANPAARALSVSQKDRSAILPLGRTKQQVYWYASNGTLTTSRWYADTLPTWVNDFNGRRVPHRSAGQMWNLLLPEDAYRERDDVSVEGAGLGPTFPHVLPADSARAARFFLLFPMMDEHLLAFALEGTERLGLGRGPGPDLLAVSLSATDQIGHLFGPESREIHDQILRLDRALGRFIDSLYRIRDSSRIVFALTADHGVAPIPELHRKYRVSLGPARRAAGEAARQAGGDTLDVDLESGAFFAVGPGRAAAVRAFTRVARSTLGVLRVDLWGDLKRKSNPDRLARRWLNMFPEDMEPAVVVTLEEGNIYNYPLVATHGSPHDYDTHVPLIFYGPPFRTARIGDEVRTVDIGPTLARAAGVRPTEPLDGRPLAQAFKR